MRHVSPLNTARALALLAAVAGVLTCAAFAQTAGTHTPGVNTDNPRTQTGPYRSPTVTGGNPAQQPKAPGADVQPQDQQTPNQPASGIPTTSVPGGPGSPDLLIGSGDLLEVSVYGAPDFDRRAFRVGSEGDIMLPLAGAVHVAGMNASQAEGVIRKKLSDGGFFNDPQVSVFVKEYATQGISILGEVQKPGVYPLIGARRLFDAISQAGGVTPKAGRVVTVTHRNDPVHPQRITWTNDAQTSNDTNVEVLPGDTIVVSKAGVVYVVGDVKLPGGFIMENGKMTVLQAIAMAQGLNPTAAQDATKLIRATPEGQKEQPVPLNKIMKAQASDLQLQPEDIVFVPNSRSKSAFRRSLEAIVQTTTGMAIYGRVP